MSITSGAIPLITIHTIVPCMKSPGNHLKHYGKDLTYSSEIVIPPSQLIQTQEKPLANPNMPAVDPHWNCSTELPVRRSPLTVHSTHRVCVLWISSLKNLSLLVKLILKLVYIK